MANRFELLLPDIAGAFHQGRAQVRQEDRERSADQEQRAQLERQNQFRQLAGQAYGAGNPADRQAAVSQAAAADPQGAMALDRQMGSNEDRKQERLGLFARVLTSIPEENNSARMLMYQQMRPEMLSLGIDAPPEYTPQVGQMAQAFMQKTSGQQPANIQEWEHYSRLPQAEQARYLEMKRAQQTFVPEIGGVRTVVRPGVAGGDTTTQALSTIEREAAAAQALSGARQQGQANVDLATKPAIAGATTAAEAAAKAAAERETLSRKNQTAFDVYRTATSNLQNALAATETGPLAGRIPAVTAAQQTAEGAQATMAPVLKDLFRQAGEGTFTEGDQKLLLDMIPKRTDHPEARAAKLQMIDQLVASKLGIAQQSASTQLQQAATEVTATGPNGQKIVLRNGQWVPLQ